MILQTAHDVSSIDYPSAPSRYPIDRRSVIIAGEISNGIANNERLNIIHERIHRAHTTSHMPIHASNDQLIPLRKSQRLPKIRTGKR